MDVYFNLPISKIIEIYIAIKNQSFICIYMLIIFEIGRLM